MSNVPAHYATFVRSFRERVESYLKLLTHSGQKGTVSERAVAELLRAFLPRMYSVEHDAVLFDTQDNLGPQCDLAVVNDFSNPRMFPDKGASVWPVDCCHAVVEVKSRLRKQDMIEAFDNAVAIKTLEYSKGSFRLPGPGEPSWAPSLPPLHIVWAWLSDCQSIETLRNWVREATDHRIYNHLPDLVLIVDKGLLLARDNLWLQNAQQPASPKRAEEPLFQAAYFYPIGDEVADAEFNLDERGNERAKVSQGRAVLNFLWSFMLRLRMTHHLHYFDPNLYLRDSVRQCQELNLGDLFLSAGPETGRGGVA